MKNLDDLLSSEKDYIDKKEVQKELNQIRFYKNYLLNDGIVDNNITNLVSYIINKYKNKIEVADYYKSRDVDQVSVNMYENLCVLDNMLVNYIERKTLIKTIIVANK